MDKAARPHFSVVIATYNRAELLARAIQSVFAQRLPDYELIVVDDGSTDETPEVLGRYGSTLQVVRQPNAGPGAARNTGLQKARGQYVVFLDSDDLWFPWTLATYAEVARQNRNPAIMAGQLCYFHDESQLDSQHLGPTRSRWFRDYFSSSRQGLYCGSGQSAIRRELLLECGGFTQENINAEDHDLIMRLGLAPGFVFIDAPAMIGYRQHPRAATQNLLKTYEGKTLLVRREKAGQYPGGKSRQLDRRRILSQHLRGVSLDLLRGGWHAPAWQLYRETFAWQLSLGRFKYLAGFVAVAAASARTRNRGASHA